MNAILSLLNLFPSDPIQTFLVGLSHNDDLENILPILTGSFRLPSLHRLLLCGLWQCSLTSFGRYGRRKQHDVNI